MSKNKVVTVQDIMKPRAPDPTVEELQASIAKQVKINKSLQEQLDEKVDAEEMESDNKALRKEMEEMRQTIAALEKKPAK